MATVGIITQAPRTAPTAVAAHPKLALVDDEGFTVTLPHAPIEAPIGGLAPVWTEVARAGGRRPLLVMEAGQAQTLSLECNIVDTRNPQASAERLDYALRVLAGRARRIFVRNYGGLVIGPWRLVDYAVAPYRRQEQTNAPTGFTASLMLKQASDAVLKVSPTTGGAATLVGPGATRVRVRAGETVASVAYRAMGSTSAAAALLAYNGIRDPRKVKVGDLLNVPPNL